MKHEIEIPDLPEGWEPVAYRVPEEGEYYFSRHGLEQATDEWPDRPAAIIVRKKQPRRIVLESTGETRKPKAGEYIQNNGNYCLCRKPDRWGNEHEIWQAVEDNKCAE